MTQEYKIFYNERVIILSAKITKSFEKNEGLFFKYPKKEEISEIIDAFVNFRYNTTLYLLSDSADILLEHVKSCYTTIEAAGGVVKRNDGKLLAILRNGKWDLPKGKADNKEKPRTTAIREVLEETGLTDVTITNKLPCTYHMYSENNKNIIKKTYWYEMNTCNSKATKPQVVEGITCVKWVKNNEIDDVLDNTFLSVFELVSNYKKKNHF
jgi:ADP-ribose pyrophosphatase YjhB (NUDIX family)